MATHSNSMAHLAKTYQPKDAEHRWYRVWETRGYFRADPESSTPPFSMVIPPPNVTGSLHIGHALNNTLQDILARWHRMRGYNVLWLPGTDHAGIATQNVVERQLNDEGTSREKLGRPAFVERVWQWKAQSGETILNQLRALGVSCDWSRLRFTLDDGLSRAVREVFVRLYEDGLIYRGHRLIHWCPRCLTALADIEVEHEETNGALYSIRYPLAGNGGRSLVIATTRPETMLGDTGVGVHPEDPRYREFVGQSIRLPLTSRDIPIVTDPILVDREFGTGAVKITPAHDFNDYEAGLRNHLAPISIFDRRATIDPANLGDVDSDVLQDIQGRPALEARKRVLRFLKDRGVLIKEEPHRYAVGKCYRCRTIVEPFLSLQWYVKVRPLADPAIKAVESGEITLIPKSWENNYLAWMREIRDWCISRQIWWGHQIPAWYCEACDTDRRAPIIARSVPDRCPKCGEPHLVQDPDVLDTWFSSALWPFSTLGWPSEQQPTRNEAADVGRMLRVFYPTTVLVTGFDILFFWVARMVMMGLKFMEAIPFREVYVHALVRDAEGQKMSKSKGNIIDPLGVMDTYGTDALRFTLAAMASPGRDIKLSEERISGYRNFANKLWNAARFILEHLPDNAEPPSRREYPASLVDRWITSRLHHCIGDVNRSLAAYRFDEAANRLYHFVWHEFCDWYLELSKPVLWEENGESTDERHVTVHVAVETFRCTLRLLHPFMPFISEELWSRLPRWRDEQEHIMITGYPAQDVSKIDQDSERDMNRLIDVVSAVRAIRSAYSISQSTDVADVAVIPSDAATEGVLCSQAERIQKIGRITSLRIGTSLERPKGRYVRNAGIDADVYVLLEGLVDFTKERTRLEKRLADVRMDLERLDRKLGDSAFTMNAPPDVVQKAKAKQDHLRVECDKVSNAILELPH